MPELPEVEAICRRLRREITGATLASARILRARSVHPQKPSSVERRLRGRTIESIERRGKNILIGLSGGATLRVHLRMTGDLYVTNLDSARPRATRALFELTDGRVLLFEDRRALGVVHACSQSELARLLADLGLEPLSAEFTADRLAKAAERSRKPAKLFLMEQRCVAGLGNAYAAEALFRARVHPRKPMNELSPAKVRALHTAIRSVLQEAVKSAVRSYRRPSDFKEAAGFSWEVYDREGEPCVRCRRKIHRIRQGGRSTYYCPGCQKL